MSGVVSKVRARSGDSAAVATEYAILTSLIAIVIFGAVMWFGSGVLKLFTEASTMF